MQALTLGIDKLFEARKIFLIAGGHKAKIIREAVEGPAIERVRRRFSSSTRMRRCSSMPRRRPTDRPCHAVGRRSVSGPMR
jgi:hypothetical protein